MPVLQLPNLCYLIASFLLILSFYRSQKSLLKKYTGIRSCKSLFFNSNSFIRPYTGEIFDDLSQDDESDEETDDSEDESNETPDSGIGRRRKRVDSLR